MNKNRIGGLRWRASQPMIAKPISIKPTTAAHCVASGYVDPYPCAYFFRVAGNGSGPPDSFPRPGRSGSRLSRLRPSLGFAHRVGTVIDGDWQRIFPETPQPFFKKSISIVGWPLQADPRFQLRDRLGIEFGWGLRTLARKRHFALRWPLASPRSPTVWGSADPCEPPPAYLFRSRSRASQPSSIHGNIVWAPALFSSILCSWPFNR